MGIIDEMQAAGVKPINTGTTVSSTNSSVGSNDIIDSMQQSGVTPLNKDSTGFQELMSGVTAFNNKIEQVTTLPYKLGVLGTDIKSKADTYMENQAAELQGLQKINPTSVAIGNTIANLGLTGLLAAAGPASLISGSGFVGAASGALQDTNSLSERGINTIIGGATGIATGLAFKGVGAGIDATGLPQTIGKGLNKLINVISNIKTAAPLLTKSADDIYSAAVQQAGAGNAINATLESAQNAFTSFVNQVRTTKNMLYRIRDQIALDNNVTVSKDALTQLLNAKNIFLDPQAKSFTNNLINSEFSDANTISFTSAKGILSNLKGKISGTKATDSGLSDSYDALASAFQQDINTATKGIKGLDDASNIADSFNANTYAPLQSTVKKFKLQDGLTNQNFINSFLKSTVNQNSNQYKAYSILPEDLKKQIVMAHFNALKDSQTSATELNVAKYAASLSRSTNQIPALQEAGININTIVNAITAKNLVNKANPGEIGKEIAGAAIGGGIAGGSEAAIGALGGLVTQKLGFLSAAGKLLTSADTTPILANLAKGNELAKPIVDNLTAKLLSAYETQLFVSKKNLELPESETRIGLGIRD